MTVDTQLETYLTALRLHLGPLTLAEREEIVREISAHVRDSAEETGATVEAILARLGPAQELARQYRDGLLISQASRSISPIVLLRATLRLATKGVFGILVFFAAIFGYAFGGGMVLCGILKPIFPQNTGVWVSVTHSIVGSGVIVPAPRPPAHEILGLWYIPIALILGSLTLLATTAIIRAALRTSQRWQARL